MSDTPECPVASPVAPITDPGRAAAALAAGLAAGLAAATVGESRLPAASVPEALRAALTGLGAAVTPTADGCGLTIRGRGLGGLRSPAAPLDLRACPDALAPLCGLIAGTPATAVVQAGALPPDLVETLEATGARVVVGGRNGQALLTVTGRAAPLALDRTAEPAGGEAGALAALTAGLTAPGETRVALPPALAGAVADALSAFGVPVRLDPAGPRLHLAIVGETETTPAHLPDDWPATPGWLARRRARGAPLTVAIDGPAAAGKGTLARALADRLGLAYLDTGLLYRATGVAVRRAGGDPDDPAAAVRAARALAPEDLADPDLRGEAAGDAASRVAAIPAVREALLAFQRDFAGRPPAGTRGAVLDGRDIGSVVCPDAPVKLFVTASVATRARRRFLELRERGVDVIESRILQDMEDRDARDRSRSVAPLVPVADAVVLDTSDIDRNAALTAALALTGVRVWARERAPTRACEDADARGAAGPTDTSDTGDS